MPMTDIRRGEVGIILDSGDMSRARTGTAQATLTYREKNFICFRGFYLKEYFKQQSFASVKYLATIPCLHQQ